MASRAFTFLFLLPVLAAVATAQSLPSFQRPCGIYAIGQHSTAGIRAYPFVDGFVMRIDWSTLEPARDAYDFSAVDAVVRRLDTLGLGLTLDVFRMRVPDYILAEPGAQTHTLQLSGSSFTTAVPWDAFALQRFEALLAALAAHPVWSIAHGTALPLREHPVLRHIDATPIGTNGIRDLNHSLTTHPTYARATFIRSVVHTAEIVRAQFPATMCFVAMFGMRDSIALPVLTDELRDSLLAGINRDPARPMVGFFQENLACNGPLAQPSNPLFACRETTFSMYQMLQAWRAPFADSSKTEPCRTDSSGPDVAMLKALETTYGTYFECYTADLDYPGYAPMFARMHDSLAALCSSVSGDVRLEEAVPPPGVTMEAIYPHPCSSRATLRYRLGSAAADSPIPVRCTVFDALGRLVAATAESVARPGCNEFELDGSSLPAGLYFIRLTAGREFACAVVHIAR